MGSVIFFFNIFSDDRMKHSIEACKQSKTRILHVDRTAVTAVLTVPRCCKKQEG